MIGYEEYKKAIHILTIEDKCQRRLSKSMVTMTINVQLLKLTRSCCSFPIYIHRCGNEATLYIGSFFVEVIALSLSQRSVVCSNQTILRLVELRSDGDSYLIYYYKTEYINKSSQIRRRLGRKKKLHIDALGSGNIGTVMDNAKIADARGY